jgi:thiamine biosynthesis lipoprotein
MNRASFSLLALILLLSFNTSAQSSTDLLARKRVLKLMGTRFEFTAVAKDIKLADEGIEAGIKEVKRIEKLISSWDKASQTSTINNNAGIQPVKVNKELFDLIERSLRISSLTNGAFDISFASVGNLWKFDGTMQKPPSKQAIDTSISKINYKNIILNPQDTSVFLKEKGMSIGFGGIGKGYAAEQAKVVMIALGIKSGVVSAAGDLTTWGTREDGKVWDVAIAKPDKSRQILAWLQADNTSIVTSGNYEKFFMYEGKRYSHIIDPRTGYPTTGIKSATVVCTNAELGDALATTMFVMGQTEGLALINQLNGIECLLITDDDRLLSSNNLNINYQVTHEASKNAHN